MKITKDNYLKATQMDKKSKAYFNKSINKTEQQKALESLLLEAINKGILDKNASYKIADLACGGGTLNYHLASFFPNATFVLLDYNEDGLDLAREFNTPFKERMQFIQGDLHTLPFEDNTFDLVFCWQTLGWVAKEDIQTILYEIIRILKPQAHFYASSLFNTEFDVGLVCKFKDLTRDSGKAGIWGQYTTFSLPTMQRILCHYIHFKNYLFYPNINFPRTIHSGIATFSYRVLEDNQKEVGENFGGAFVETKDFISGIDDKNLTALNMQSIGGGAIYTNISTSANLCGYAAQLGDFRGKKIA
ncbi:class I SAM-dependent methyltransferase [uncultured Helicobacter sp.]|uniref:class I SAM-dependent methyltransferase n=3 Tax=uncultured Helicobacter sp. TaxID=175537 RepID=UPI00261C7A28|nr:class I SAM-dependent methyltransferase [uncultured Helicobacter sp.]